MGRHGAVLGLVLTTTLAGMASGARAAEEQPRARAQPAAPMRGMPAPSRPNAGPRAGVPARPMVDGRGRVMDGRYNHGRFYAPVGTVTRTLPPDYRPYYHHGAPYYFSGGAWYAPRAGGFVVVTPPVGVVIAALPPYYSTVWIGGMPYYYADNVYYTWQADQNGYVVAPAPEGAGDAPPADGGDPGQYSAPPPAADPTDLIIYPKNGQSKDQQAADQYECHDWARGQTGFDPSQPNDNLSQAEADQRHSNYDRAMVACLSGRGYQVN